MKKLILFTGIVMLAMQSQAQFKKATLQATGLTCSMCNNAINKALQGVPFVETVRSDIKNSAFLITFKEGTTTDIDALKTAVEDAGFSIGSLQLTGHFTSTAIENDRHLTLGQNSFHFVDVKQQTLDGEATIKVIDRDFISARQFKRVRSLSNMQCVENGRSASCCTAHGIPANARVYHVTI